MVSAVALTATAIDVPVHPNSNAEQLKPTCVRHNSRRNAGVSMH